MKVITSTWFEYTQNKPAEPDWLVKGLITRGSRNVLFGDTSVGKSRLVVGLLLAILRGEAFLDEYQCAKGKVHYIVNDMPEQDWFGILRKAQNKYPDLCGENATQSWCSGNFDIVKTMQDIRNDNPPEWAQDAYNSASEVYVIDAFNNSFLEETEKPHLMKRIVFAWREFQEWLPGNPTLLFIVQETKGHPDKIAKHAYSGAYPLAQDMTCMIRLWEKEDGAEIKHMTITKARGLPKQATIDVSLDDDAVLFYNVTGDPSERLIRTLLTSGEDKHEIKRIYLETTKQTEGAFSKKWQKTTGKLFSKS